MSARKLDGKELSQVIRQELTATLNLLTETRPGRPGLAAVLVGDNPASQVYVRNKRKACADVGINSWLHHLPGTASQDELLTLVSKLNTDPEVNGILVQLPLPKQIDEAAVIRAISPSKDVDAFHPENLGLLAAGMPRFLPCTPFGVVQMLVRNKISLQGAEVVVLGRSNIVGKPLALMLMQKQTPENPYAGDATVTVVHRQTREIKQVCRRADVLIAALGQPEFVTADMVKPGAVVIDVGINQINGKLVGDVESSGVAEVASALSPVPGGVGPMTITMLLYNTVISWQKTSEV